MRVKYALAGIAALLAALAAGHLVAVVVGPAASPAVAVAAWIVDLAPAGVVNWAKSTFGTADKAALGLGLALVLGAFALVTGMVARRNLRAAYGIVAALAVVGAVAVLTRPDVGPFGVLAPVVSAAAGLGTLHLLLNRPAEADDAEPADGSSRRKFLLTAGGVIVGSLAAGGIGQWLAGPDVDSARRAIGRLIPKRRAPAIPAGADFVADGTPPMITSNKDFYKIDTALTPPRVDIADWQLRLHGMVDNEMTLTFDDLRKRTLVERTLTLSCVSNPVGGDLISTATFVGVDLPELLHDAGVQRGAEQLFCTSVDGWTAGTDIVPALERQRGAMLAMAMNGAPLPVEHGFPVRMIVPGLYGYVSATKWLTDIEVTTWDKQTGYWIPRGWSRLGPVKTESRIDKTTVHNGQLTVAGTAWAPTRGIAKVEVRVDDGPWHEAQLATEVSKNTWRMWRATIDVGQGNHRVTCRATDGTGATQTAAEAAEAPNGASGWHSVPFSV